MGALNCTDSEHSTCSQEGEVDCYPTCSSDTSQSEQLKSIPIASRAYQDGKKTVTFHGFQSLRMLPNSMEGGSRDSSTLLPAGSLNFARIFPVLERAKESQGSALAFGDIWQESSVRYDRDTCSWKTHRSLWEEDLPESSVTLPKEGMMRDGCIYQRRTSARTTREIASGLWPTPCAMEPSKDLDNYQSKLDKPRSERGGGNGPNLGTAVKMWQTPVSDDSVNRTDGKVNSRCEPKLPAQVLQWPTPTVQDGNGRTHHNQRDGSKTPILLGRVQSFPTPNATDYKGASQPPGRRPECDDDLPSRIAKYPTPTSSMVTVGDMEQARFAGNDPRRPEYRDCFKATTELGGQLNADWVELLMGWPKGWSDLEPLTHIDDDWYTWPADWERNTPRVAVKQPHRTARLKAIGNGQVPACAATAFMLLCHMDVLAI